jgi:GT2 family glycosyltransferase
VVCVSGTGFMIEETRPSLCVVNYNGGEVLEQTLGTAWSLRHQFREILLVDNASTDASVAIVRRRFPDVHIILLPENRGPAAARNAGFLAATSDQILFIDNDVCLSERCGPELTNALVRHPRAAAAMPQVRYAKRPDTVQFDGAHAHFLGLMVLENADLPVECASASTRPLGSLVTACFVLHRGRWGSLPPFDETFFFNYEDHDFGVRCRVLGHQILSVPIAFCYHGDGTEGLSLRRTGRYAALRVNSLIRNRWQLVLKTYTARTLILLSPAFALYEVAQLATAIRKGWGREWLRAASWIVCNAHHLSKKRRWVQRKRKTPDRELLSDGRLPFHRFLTPSRTERTLADMLSRVTSAYWRGVARFV